MNDSYSSATVLFSTPPDSPAPNFNIGQFAIRFHLGPTFEPLGQKGPSHGITWLNGASGPNNTPWPSETSHIIPLGPMESQGSIEPLGLMKPLDVMEPLGPRYNVSWNHHWNRWYHWALGSIEQYVHPV